jgi:hypothetical protein
MALPIIDSIAALVVIDVCLPSQIIDAVEATR